MYKLLLAFTLLALSVSAQTVLGTLTGRVLDASGAAVTNADVIATNTGTNLAFKSKTNDAGNFVIQQLPVGTYELTVEAVGFRRYVRRNIELNVAQTLTVDANLEVGQVEQAVEVTADVTTLQTSTS
ncbi:MAG TPA: carboxypeptidase-like regulatory domain-containing protein, partial [Bryobacteraceae bacterium]|nr:carboxypeptidase-like regulatory domain-containing protein [Bryobacteraceae bacterium]